MLVNLTDKAKEQLSYLCDSKKKAYVLLQAKGGGCAGFMYDWSFMEKSEIGEKDNIINVGKNANLVIDGKSEFALVGMNVDYVEEVFGSHFEINNPNAKSGCGCGVSFSV